MARCRTVASSESARRWRTTSSPWHERLSSFLSVAFTSGHGGSERHELPVAVRDRVSVHLRRGLFPDSLPQHWSYVSINLLIRCSGRIFRRGRKAAGKRLFRITKRISVGGPQHPPPAHPPTEQVSLADLFPHDAVDPRQHAG